MLSTYERDDVWNISVGISTRVIQFRPRQDGYHFPDDILKCIYLNENVLISSEISLKFVPKGPINNIPALVQIMVWRRPVSLLTHICVIRPQWVKGKIIWHLSVRTELIWRKYVLAFYIFPCEMPLVMTDSYGHTKLQCVTAHTWYEAPSYFRIFTFRSFPVIIFLMIQRKDALIPILNQTSPYKWINQRFQWPVQKCTMRSFQKQGPILRATHNLFCWCILMS